MHCSDIHSRLCLYVTTMGKFAKIAIAVVVVLVVGGFAAYSFTTNWINNPPGRNNDDDNNQNKHENKQNNITNEGQETKTDFVQSPKCPGGWTLVNPDTDTCKAPESYKGPCATISTFMGYSSTDKRKWEEDCKAPFPKS